MLTTTGRLLRERTADVHHRLEAVLDLAAPSTDAERLLDVLTRFHAFWSAAECAVDGWAAREPQLATDLDWPRRRRSGRLAADVGALSVRTGRSAESLVADPALTAPDTPEVLGWLYVSEGSTLGGAVIDRALRNNPTTADLVLRSFTPYDEGPQPMWRAFHRVLDAWTAGDELRTERVVAAAVHTFTALADWTAPLGVEAVA